MVKLSGVTIDGEFAQETFASWIQLRPFSNIAVEVVSAVPAVEFKINLSPTVTAALFATDEYGISNQPGWVGNWSVGVRVVWGLATD